MLSLTANKAIEFYGGKELWKNSLSIEAVVSVTGLAFTLKRRPFFHFAKIKMEIGKPISRITPIGKDKNITGILNEGDVRLEDEKGNLISERKDARKYFGFGRRIFYWDDLDMAYFANYAFWNYFTLPNLLMNSEIQWIEKKEGHLEAIFPDSIPTHSKRQEFYFEKETGKLIQHNYTADIISKFAKATNFVTEHTNQNGLEYPCARKVTPSSLKGNALPGPILIDIKIHDYKLIESGNL